MNDWTLSKIVELLLVFLVVIYPGFWFAIHGDSWLLALIWIVVSVIFVQFLVSIRENWKDLGLVERAVSVMFICFLVFPFFVARTGPRFVDDRLNYFVGSMWILMPLPIAGFGLFLRRWMYKVFAFLFGILWICILAFGILFWIGYFIAIGSGEGPKVLISKANLNTFQTKCSYIAGGGATGGPETQTETVETVFFPGLKWVEIRSKRVE